MAIIYSYPESLDILATDLILGTATIRVGGKKKNITKNFSVETLALFIQDNYPTATPNLNQVLTAGNVSLLNANIQQLGLFDNSEGAYGLLTLNANVFEAVEAYGNTIFNVSNANFRMYKTAGGPSANISFSGTVDRNYQLPDASGTIALVSDIPTKTSELTNDGADGINPFITAADIPPGTQDLDSVLTIGNTSLLDANIGNLGIWDNTNSGYLKIEGGDNNFTFKDSASNTIIYTEQGILAIHKTNSIAGSFNTSLLSLSRNYALPNQSGTIALISDIPVVTTPNLNQVLTEGNTSLLDANIGKLGIWDSFNSGYLKIEGGDNSFIFKRSDLGTMLTVEDGLIALQNGSIVGSISTSFLTTTQTYALPNQSGTFALISDIPSLLGYVPYTGATQAVNLGAYNLTVNNISVGKGSGTGTGNTAVGGNALLNNTTGEYNSAFGSASAVSNTTGSSNTSIGALSLQLNTTGNGNSAIGRNSLSKNTTGSSNTAVGTSSLNNNTTGAVNVAIGSDALFNNTTGFYNSALGTSSLVGSTTGNNNSAFGYEAGRYIADKTTSATILNNSLMLGWRTSPLANNQTNQIVIGYDAIGAGSNTVTLGNTSITTTRLRGDVQGGAFVKDGGTSLQYLMADGSVSTGPSLTGYVPTTTTLTINGTTYDLSANRTWSVGTVTSVGLTMPVAFSVSNSPITGAGDIAVTAVGTSAQYIRGDGQLATFPTSGGGGSSVTYYLNGSIPSSVAGYQQMDNNAVIGPGTDFSLTGNGLIAQFLTDAGNPNRVEIPGGGWNFEMFFNISSVGGNTKFYVDLLKYDGSIFTLISSGSTNPEQITGGTSVDLYLTSLAVPTTPLLITDRLAIRVYIVDNSGGRTATLHTEDNNLCEIITTFSSGVASLNGLTASTQYFAVGTSGMDFNISSLVDTHTFNLPTASATVRGALSSADWTAFNSKFNLPSLTSGSVLFSNGTTIAQDNANFFWDDTNNRLGIGNILPVAPIDLGSLTGTAGDISKIALYSSPIYGTYGFGVSAAQLDYVSGGSHVFYSNSPSISELFRIDNTGTLTSLSLIGSGTRMVTASSAGVLSTQAITLGTVTSVAALTLGTTGTDLSSSVANSTTTPVITLNVPTASAANRGALSSTDWSTFNSKQGALTLTTTGTSGASTLIGDTLNIPQYSGGGGGSIISSHTFVKPLSGSYYSNVIAGGGVGTFSNSANILYLVPYIPAYTFSISQISINITTIGVAGTTMKILIFSDNNGIPSSKLIESTTLDITTLGIKTYTVSYTFNAGTTYWLSIVASAGSGAFSTNSNFVNVGSALSTINYNAFSTSVTYASIPSTLSLTSSNLASIAAAPRIIFRAI